VQSTPIADVIGKLE